MKTTKKMLNFANKHASATAVVLFILMLTVGLGFSWICTCGIIKLITMCFGWTFSCGTATGVWLLMMLARTVFNHTTTVKK